MRRHVTAGALALLLMACGDENETSGTVTQTPPEEVPGAAEAPPPAEDPPAGAAGENEAAGPVVDDPTFELRAAADGPYRQGELGQFAITLTPKTGWKVNEEFPMAVEIEAPSEAGVSHTELEREDAAEFAEARARFDVPFTPTAAGEHRVEANVRFAVCTPENCIPDERTLALVLPVE